MDEETLKAICETYRDLTVDEVAEAIMASSHADKVADPQQLAEYIVAACAAY